MDQYFFKGDMRPWHYAIQGPFLSK